MELFKDKKEALERLNQLLQEEEPEEELEETDEEDFDDEDFDDEDFDDEDFDDEDFDDEDYDDEDYDDENPEDDEPEEEPVIYHNYSNNYGRIYNSDVSDRDLDEFSDEVYESKKRRDILVLTAIALALAAAIMGVLAWWIARYL